MVNSKVSAKRKVQEKPQETESYGLQERGTLLTITGTTLDTLGKVMLAGGITVVLLLAMTALEGLLGFGSLTTACIAIGTGVTSLVLGNKLSHNRWFSGLLAA